MRDVRTRGGIPVCAGQSEYSPRGCRDLMERGAIDVCNFDASWSGGYTNWRRMAAGGAALQRRARPPRGAAGRARTCSRASRTARTSRCFHPDRDPIWWNLIANRPELVDGELALPDGPGLGWELDRDYIDRYRVAL